VCIAIAGRKAAASHPLGGYGSAPAQLGNHRAVPAAQAAAAAGSTGSNRGVEVSLRVLGHLLRRQDRDTIAEGAL
jgi:hypothetical protein